MMALPTPLFLAKANLSDPSPFCRHLMLLTESSAALRLLFECGLLKKDKTVVLVGSQFPRDANSELRMVRQINEIKRAMQSGHTVVLVNHEGIFPSLYDVLNMRYTTKRNADTGKVTRMLRLAVGNRSQWCAVGPGFKIVVIVETKDAYEKLDLPLLNRFEKQMLRAEDALETPEAKEMLRVLKLWIKQVETATRVKDPFIGIYSQTLASLVHCRRLQLERLERRGLDMEKDLDALKLDLIELMSPLARIRGANATIDINESAVTTIPATDGNVVVGEREEAKAAEGAEEGPPRVLVPALPSSEPQDSENFLETVQSCIADRTHLIVLTFSSSHDFEVLMKNAAGPVKSLLGDAEPIALGGVTSEREFVQALIRGKSQVRFVQCDPNSTPQETIEHARYLAVQELRNQNEIVCFIIHLPPGGRKKRTYNVDHQVGWKVKFIDDLLRPDFMSLVNASPLAWADNIEGNNTSNLLRVVRTKLSVALAMARPPLVSGAAVIGARERVQQIMRLLDNNAFTERVIDGAVRDVLGMMKNDEHVEMVARGEARAGTVADSLVLALETLIVRAFAMAIRWFDLNFNLALLTSDEEPIKELWILLCVPPSVDIIAANQIELSSGVITSTIRNSGRPGLPVVAEFPWSWRVYETLEQALTESAKVAAVSPDNFTDKERFLRGVAETVFTAKFLDSSAAYVARYIKDVCGFQAHRRAEISVEEQTRLVQSWLLRRDPGALASIPRAHLLLSTESWALFALLSIRCALAALEFPDGVLNFSIGFIELIADFLLQSSSLGNPLWNPVIQLLSPHMLDTFLELEGKGAKVKWMDVLFRQAYSEATMTDPHRVPTDLARTVTKPNFRNVAQATNRYLSLIAREVVARSWFDDASFMKTLLTEVAADFNVDRTVRLSVMEAVLRHPADAREGLNELILETAELFALALDLCEDIRTREDLFAPGKVIQVVE